MSKLTSENVDFTEIEKVNLMIKTKNIIGRRKKINYVSLIKPIIILNCIIPWFIWKYIESRIEEFEFIDTFRYGINSITVSLNFGILTYLLSYFFNLKIGIFYLISSLLLILLYSKLHPIPAK